MSGMGWIECCGVIVPVESIRMEPGAFIIAGQLRGPVQALSGPAAVYCSDGQLFTEGPWFTVEATPRWSTLTLVVCANFTADNVHRVVQGAIEGSGAHPLAPASRR